MYKPPGHSMVQRGLAATAIPVFMAR